MPVSACSNGITALSFDTPPPADLNMPIYITCLCSQSHYSSVSSRDVCMQNSPQTRPFTIAVAIVFAGPGFIMAQEEPKAAHVELDAGKNIMVLRHHSL